MVFISEKHIVDRLQRCFIVVEVTSIYVVYIHCLISYHSSVSQMLSSNPFIVHAACERSSKNERSNFEHSL